MALADVGGRTAVSPKQVISTFQNRTAGANNILQELGPRAPSVNMGAAPSGVNQGTPLTRSAPSPFTPPSPITIPGGGLPGGGFGGAGTGGFESTFEKGPGTPGSFVDQVDPFLTDIVKSRAMGEGVGPEWGQVFSDVYEPQAALIDERAKAEREASIEDLVSRGVLSSSTAAKNLTELTRKTELDKRALFGQLSLDFEDKKQRAIGEAIGQLNILEGNKLSSRTTITAANINASAQVRAASIGANASVAAAKIGAQARLQEAGMNAQLALERLNFEKEMTAFEAGVDLSDPQSVQDWYDYQLDVREQEKAINEFLLEEALNRSRGNA